MTGHASRPGDPGLSAAEVKQRAARGAGVVALRGLGIRTLGFISSLVLARLLTPRDFGLLAVGATVLAFVDVFASAGLGAGLIRREADPDREDLRALLFAQLVLTCAFATGTCALAFRFGEGGRITALMVGAVPLSAIKTPALVQLERRLDYGPIAVAELLEVLAATAWSITTVALGWGPAGVATSRYVAGIVGGAVAVGLSPQRIVSPLPSWRRARPLLRFGVMFQASTLAGMVRDQGLNLGIASVAGVGMLGQWSLANRILQVPFVMFQALWQVSFPAASRLRGSEELGPALRRGFVAATAATGLLLSALAGAGPALVMALFGSEWREASEVIPFASMALLISGPVSVTAAGYLLAEGRAGRVLWAVVVPGTLWLSIALPTVDRFGLVAVGVGLLASATCEAALLARALRQRVAVPVTRLAWKMWLSAFVAGTCGYLVSVATGQGFLAAGLGAGVAAGMFAGAQHLWDPETLRSTAAIIRSTIRRQRSVAS